MCEKDAWNVILVNEVNMKAQVYKNMNVFDGFKRIDSEDVLSELRLSIYSKLVRDKLRINKDKILDKKVIHDNLINIRRTLKFIQHEEVGGDTIERI